MCSGLSGGHIFSHQLKALRYSQFRKPKISFFGIVYAKLEVKVGCASVITRETSLVASADC